MTSILYESQNQLRREQDEQRLLPAQATLLHLRSCPVPAPPVYQTSPNKACSSVPKGIDGTGLTASYSRPVSPSSSTASSDGESTKNEANAFLAAPADTAVAQMTPKEAILAPMIAAPTQQVTIASVPVPASAPTALQPAPAPGTWQPQTAPVALQPAPSPAQAPAQATVTGAPTLIPSTPIVLQSSFPSLQAINLSSASVPTPILPYGATTFAVTAPSPAPPPPVISSPSVPAQNASMLPKTGQNSSPVSTPLEPGSPSPPQPQQSSQQSSNGGNSNSLRLNKFVRRLHDMLQSEKDSGIVEWRRGLLILHSTDTFGKKILPRYFNTRNFKTFRRQLNYYGFVHVRSFSATGSTTTALWVNQDLAKRGCENISSVLLLKRVEPCEAAKTAEGRRVRKEEAVCAVEDIGISTRSLQFEHIRSLTLQRSHDDDPSTTTIDSTAANVEAFESAVTTSTSVATVTPGPTMAPTMPTTAPAPPSQPGFVASQTAFLPLVVHCHQAPPKPTVVTPPSDQGADSSDDSSSATSQAGSDHVQPMEVSNPATEGPSTPASDLQTTAAPLQHCGDERLHEEQAPPVHCEQTVTETPSSADDAANLLLMLSRSKTCSLSTTSNAVESAVMTEPAAAHG